MSVPSFDEIFFNERLLSRALIQIKGENTKLRNNIFICESRRHRHRSLISNTVHQEISFKTLFLYLYMLGFQVIFWEKHSDKKLFIISLFFIYTFQVKEFILAGKVLYPRFFKSELAPPQEVPKLNERPGRSFDQISLEIVNYSDLSINYHIVGDFGKTLVIRSRHERLILARKSHNWASDYTRSGGFCKWIKADLTDSTAHN